ncbi:MAG: magnesium transporter [SAR324 cluster bacterium]|nr:magnesium transporter [SAR324 cluster bacterium]
MGIEKKSHHKLIKKLINTQRTEALRGLLKDLDVVEIMNSFLQLKLKYQLDLLEALPKEIASDVLAQLHNYSPVFTEVVEQMNAETLGGLIEEMDGDDAADVVAVLDEEKADEILGSLPLKEREEITNLMKYDSESAGGIMDPDVVAVQKEHTVAKAIQEIRKYTVKEDIEKFYIVYVIDEFQHLIGFVDIHKLLLTEATAFIKDLMDPNVVAVDVEMDQEHVANIVREYDLVVVPVIDKYLKLIGRITIDDVMDVLNEEFYEDLGHIAGTGDEEVLETSVFRTSKDRIPWLILGLVGGFGAALAMESFAVYLEKLPEVMYFIPLIAALGGNIAIQSSSIIVRGLGTGEIQATDLFVRLWKELRVSFLNGPVCAIILFGMVLLLTDNLTMGIVAGCALIAVVVLATVVGSAVPMLLKRVNIDPALATGPFITTANDLLGVIVYLSITLTFTDIPV